MKLLKTKDNSKKGSKQKRFTVHCVRPRHKYLVALLYALWDDRD